jgi:hypothetical protein
MVFERVCNVDPRSFIHYIINITFIHIYIYIYIYIDIYITITNMHFNIFMKMHNK